MATSASVLPTPTSKVDIDPVFERMLEMLRDAAEKNANAVAEGTAPVWHVPTSWPGNLDDWEAMTKAFDRSKLNELTAKAQSDAASPGVTGDLIMGTLQIDYLAAAARAFHARYASKPRRLALTTARLKGQGQQEGVYKGSILQFVRALAVRSKTKGTS